MSPEKDMRLVVTRTLRGLCPNCGLGRLMKSYLKQVQHCASCGEGFGHIRADDAPPWLTIVIVGHIVVMLAYEFERHTAWPVWMAVTLWCAVALGLSLLMLPRAKSLFIGIIWATRTSGSELH